MESIDKPNNNPGGVGFSSALMCLKEGLYVQRAGWNGKGMYVFLIGERYDSGYGHWTYTNGKNDNVAVRPFLAMKTAQGDVVPWVASQSDILCEDWFVVE